VSPCSAWARPASSWPGATGCSSRDALAAGPGPLIGAYGPELARVHHEGFGDIARQAAALLLDALAAAGHTDGLVVDLGSGSGILTRLVTDAGFDGLGFDLSPDMVRLASAHAPAARFVEAAVLDADIPPCVAVAAVGEIVNYAFDPRTDLEHLAPLFRRVRESLQPGGVLLFDSAGPGRAGPTGRREGVVESDGWTIRSVAEEDEDRDGPRLVRRALLVTADGAHHDETHVLRLYRPAEVEALLAEAGFGDVRRLTHYRDFELPVGLTGFLARV
jgi:SAM-dependent methyltransferase